MEELNVFFDNLVKNPYFSISGWILTFLSFIYALFQRSQKIKLKLKIANLQNKNSDNSINPKEIGDKASDNSINNRDINVGRDFNQNNNSGR